MSKLNSKPIDIVIPWVNPTDRSWQKEYRYWKQKETGESDTVRFRDVGVFNYWFRCIDTNMPFVRYVFLILANRSQIPTWLNTDCEKLKIVFHEDFIPKSELPTFNSSVINSYVPFIKDVSDNYILFNDDMFVMKPSKEEDWFINDTPVYFLMHEKYRRNGSWSENIVNSKALVGELFNFICDSNPEHGPIANIKPLNLFLWKKLDKLMSYALQDTRFRNKKNITDWIFFFFTVSMGKYKPRRVGIVQYNGGEQIPDSNKMILCANDTALIHDYNKYKTNLLKRLNKFNTKSRYER